MPMASSEEDAHSSGGSPSPKSPGSRSPRAVAFAVDEGVLTKETYELVGLNGELAKYNGTVTRVFQLENVKLRNGTEDQRFRVDINNALTLRLPGKNVRPLSEFEVPIVPDAAWQVIQQEADTIATNDHNRGSLKRTVDKLSMELRRVFKARINSGQGRGKSAFTALFDDIDSDHNGFLDKKEFYEGCKSLGIAMQPREINLIWPVFDQDGDGFIDPDELCCFLDERSSGRRNSAQMVTMSANLREQRIRAKTIFGNQQEDIGKQVRRQIKEKMERDGLTAEDMFIILDVDKSGTIDRGEFLGCMNLNGIKVTLEYMNILWPRFSLDAAGTIALPEWESFIAGKAQSGYKMTQDKFTSILCTSGDPIQGVVSADIKRTGGVPALLSRSHRRKPARTAPKTTPAERAAVYANFDLVGRSSKSEQRNGSHETDGEGASKSEQRRVSQETDVVEGSTAPTNGRGVVKSHSPRVPAEKARTPTPHR